MYFSYIMHETNVVLQILQHTLGDQMNALLKYSGFLRSRYFQIENICSNFEENIGVNQITKLSIVHWAIIIYTFLIFAHTFGHGTQTGRNLLRIFLAAH